MKKIVILILVVLLISGIFLLLNKKGEKEMNSEMSYPVINPISHASFVMNWGEFVIYNDPVGDSSQYLEISSLTKDSSQRSEISKQIILKRLMTS